KVDRYGKAGLGRVLERRVDRRAVAAHQRGAAVDDGLRRIYVAIAARLRVLALALGEVVTGERVLPAEIVPIIDRERKGENVFALRELAQKLIGGRTGGAPLTGKQLHDRPWFRQRREARQKSRECGGSKKRRVPRGQSAPIRNET